LVRSEDRQAKGQLEGLTCIPQRIHYPATPKGESLMEVDIMAIETFLDALVDVAMVAASRRLKENTD